MAKGPASKAVVGSASIREVTSGDDVVTVREGRKTLSREPITFIPPNDPEFVDLTDEELDRRLLEMRAEKRLLTGRLRAAVAEYDFRKTR